MRVEIHLIGGDVYVNGKKIIFAVPFNPDNPSIENPATKYKEYTSVDWLIAWAKVGLMSQGHIVPDFPCGRVENFHAVEPHLEVQNGSQNEPASNQENAQQAVRENGEETDANRDTSSDSATGPQYHCICAAPPCRCGATLAG